MIIMPAKYMSTHRGKTMTSELSFLASLLDFFTYEFLALAGLATILLALICGILSPLIIAKKFAFIGEGISHSTMVGLAIALSLFNMNQPTAVFLTTLAVTWLLVFFLAKASYRQRLPTDSLIGIYLTTSLGLGVLIHTLFADKNSDLLSFLFGNILLLGWPDLSLLAAVLLLVLLFVVRPIKSWIHYAYDEENALISGIPLKLYHYGLMFLLGLVVVCAIKVAGTVLSNSLLLIPGALAYKIGKNMRQVFFISLLFALGSCLIGLILSNWLSLPPGATLAVTQFLLFLSILFAKKIKRIGRN